MFSEGAEMYLDRATKWGAHATYYPYVAGHDPEMWDLAFARIAPEIFPQAHKEHTPGFD
jgi:hypothetical protein